jgi:hypothetical protein
VRLGGGRRPHQLDDPEGRLAGPLRVPPPRGRGHRGRQSLSHKDYGVAPTRAGAEGHWCRFCTSE